MSNDLSLIDYTSQLKEETEQEITELHFKKAQGAAGPFKYAETAFKSQKEQD